MLKVRHDGRHSVGAGPDTKGTTTAQRRLDQRKSAGAVEESCGPQYRTPLTSNRARAAMSPASRASRMSDSSLAIAVSVDRKAR